MKDIGQRDSELESLGPNGNHLAKKYEKMIDKAHAQIGKNGDIEKIKKWTSVSRMETFGFCFNLPFLLLVF